MMSPCGMLHICLKIEGGNYLFICVLAIRITSLDECVFE